MRVDLDPGIYIVAVSGGVDSMVLLDLLAKSQLVVAHFNHGIREGSMADEEFVVSAAANYGLTIEIGRGHLGAKASEAEAREARYRFLNKVRQKYGVEFIITAHHQDDLIETAYINILRGTSRKGLSAIASNPAVKRPLLGYSKQEIINYAKAHKLKWREDPSNADTSYLRNYLRVKILPSLTKAQRENLVKNVEKVAKINIQANSLIATISHSICDKGRIDRVKFASLPQKAANELVAYWLSRRKFSSYDTKTLERLNLAIKTAKPGSRHKVASGLELVLSQKYGHFERGK